MERVTPSPALQVIHAGSVGPSCHPVKVHQRSGTPRFLLSSATQACHFSLARSLGCLALFQGQKRPVPGLKARQEYWVVVHCFLHLGGCVYMGSGENRLSRGQLQALPPRPRPGQTGWLSRLCTHPRVPVARRPSGQGSSPGHCYPTLQVLTHSLLLQSSYQKTPDGSTDRLLPGARSDGS